MTPPMLNYKTILLFLLLSHHGLSLNILAIVTLPYKSHYMAFRTLFRELAVRGHNVTVVNNFPDADPPPNLRYIDLQYEKFDSMPTLDKFEEMDSTQAYLLNIYSHISKGQRNVRMDCEQLFKSVNLKVHFSEGQKYDVIFVEQFISDCGLAYALTMYDSPIIGIASHVLLPFVYPRLGIPFDVSADQFYFSIAGPNPSLFHKLETFIFKTFINSVGRWLLHKHIYEAFDVNVPNRSLDIERDVKQRMKMMFSYQHYSVTGARLLAPQLLEIAGIHIGVPKAVPKNIEEFLSDAKHGAIYVSFGSNLKASTMSQKKLQHFLTAFRSLSQKVIWKYENASFSEKNIYTGDWFPQLDILCHPKVIGFVSHGGMLSLSESAHCGKPLVTVPFFGDQYSNSAAAKAVGIGITLYFDQLNSDSLVAAIRKLTSTVMQENAQRVSRMWHDRPVPVMDSVIYWTEYVARYKSAPPSLPSKFCSWYDSLLIDVATVIFISVVFMGLGVYILFKIITFILVKIKNLFVWSKVKSE